MQDILSGVRILDLTSVIAGPFATQILGDYGADVIKVERPSGDTVRHTGVGKTPGMSGMFLNNNRNKRGVAVDLKNPAGLEVVLRLAATCDVFIHNIRAKAMSRLGLSFENIRAVNPKIIYVNIVGYGQRGPYARFPAYDDMIQAAIALPALMKRAGSADPRYVPMAIADRVASYAAATAILAALLKRARDDRSQNIEVPMFETMAQLVLSDHLGGRTYSPPISSAGYSRLLSPDRRPYATSDGMVCALLYSDRDWRRFMQLAGREQLMEQDCRLQSMAARTQHVDELYAMAAGIFFERTTAEWMELLRTADIPVMPFIDLEGLCDDPHLHASGAIIAGHHPTQGEILVVAPPVRWLGENEFSVGKGAPRLGEHGREVLAEAGFTTGEIEALLKDGVLIDSTETRAVSTGKIDEAGSLPLADAV